MKFTFEERPSDSPLVDVIWRTHSADGGSFISLAENRWSMVVTQQYGTIDLTILGPGTVAKPAPVPENAEFFGINFKVGSFMPELPVYQLVDRGINLPETTRRTFRLLGSTWEFPDFENADTFIQRLIRAELLVYDPVIEAALQDRPPDLTPRTVQRRFLQATGLTQGSIRQIERARHATTLLEQGTPILDVVDLAGYSDQPHLTRSLKRYMGQTPAQIASGTPHVVFVQDR